MLWAYRCTIGETLARLEAPMSSTNWPVQFPQVGVETLHDLTEHLKNHNLRCQDLQSSCRFLVKQWHPLLPIYFRFFFNQFSTLLRLWAWACKHPTTQTVKFCSSASNLARLAMRRLRGKKTNSPPTSRPSCATHPTHAHAIRGDLFAIRKKEMIIFF